MSTVLSARKPVLRAIVTVLFLGNGLIFGAWAANIPRIRQLHGLTDTGLGTLLLAFGLGAVAAMALSSPLVARIGAGRVATVACVLLALLFPLIAVLSDWFPLLALAAAIGALTGAMDVSMNAYASQLERRWGGAIMSSFHAGWSLGGLAGALLSGLLATLGWSVTGTLVVASGMLAAAGVVGLALPELEGTAPPAAAFRLPSRALAGICLMAALCFQAEGAIGDWSGVYLNTVIGTDEAWATTGYTAYALAMVAGRVTGDAVVRRLGPQRVVRLGGLLALLGLGIALGVPNRWAVDGGLVVVGAGLANIVPVVFSAAGRMAGTAGVAMVSATGYAGLLVAPPVLGSVADAIGLRLALTLVLLAIGLMVLLSGAIAGRPAGAG